MKIYKVYAKGSSAGKFSLELMFEGTRYACEKLIKTRTRQNLPTQFLEISTLDYGRAFRKFEP